MSQILQNQLSGALNVYPDVYVKFTFISV